VLSFDVTAIGVLGVLAMHWVITSGGRNRWDSRFWIAWGAASLLLAGWLAVSFTALFRQSQAGFGVLLKRFQYGSTYYLGQINAHVMPLPVMLTLAFLKGNATDRYAAGLLTTVVAGGIGGAMLSPVRFFRYAVPVLPLVLALAAIGLDALGRRGRLNRVLAAAIVAGVLTSTAPFVLSHTFFSAVAQGTGLVKVRGRVFEYRVPLVQLVQELRDPPRGPIAAVVEYLGTHAGPNDVVVTSYGELPLKFHTRLTVYGGETAQLPPDGVAPSWLWRRHLGSYRLVRASEERIDQALRQGNYERIELPVVDRRWENREDPELHIFTNPGPAGPPVVLYRLKRGAE
jgi:hypothetical protein